VALTHAKVRTLTVRPERLTGEHWRRYLCGVTVSPNDLVRYNTASDAEAERVHREWLDGKSAMPGAYDDALELPTPPAAITPRGPMAISSGWQPSSQPKPMRSSGS
jgi:hypothetical protein